MGRANFAHSVSLFLAPVWVSGHSKSVEMAMSVSE